MAGFVGVFGFAYVMRLQLRATEYRAPVYWSAVMMVAIFGTMAADGVHLVGLPYSVTTPFYAVVVGAIFTVAPQRGHAVDPQHRDDAARALLLGRRTGDVALGTAAGDLTAIQLKLGYLAFRRDLRCRRNRCPR